MEIKSEEYIKLSTEFTNAIMGVFEIIGQTTSGYNLLHSNNCVALLFSSR
jgi:hypothetical protein